MSFQILLFPSPSSFSLLSFYLSFYTRTFLLPVLFCCLTLDAVPQILLPSLFQDVQETLVEIANDFIEKVVTFSCHLAKHRGSDTLEARDVQLHLGTLFLLI